MFFVTIRDLRGEEKLLNTDYILSVTRSYLGTREYAEIETIDGSKFEHHGDYEKFLETLARACSGGF